MKKLILILVVFLVLISPIIYAQMMPFPGPVGVAGGGVAGPWTDNFNRSNETPMGGNWTTITGYGNINLSSNVAVAAGSESSGVRYNAVSPNADQYSQCKLAVDWGYAGPAVRISSSAKTFYVIQVESAVKIEVYRVVADSWTSLGSRTVSDMTLNSSIVKLSVSGVGSTVTLKVYVDDVQQGADFSDTNAARITAAGSFGFYAEQSGEGVDDWEGGNL